MKTVVVLVVAMMIAGAILLVAQPALAAEAAERPQWAVGDKWTFRAIENPGAHESMWTREVIIARRDGTFVVETDRNTRPIFDAETNSLDRRGPEYTWRRFKFPLTVGASWSHDYKTAGAEYHGDVQSSWSVVAFEKITVPAGTFECFKVEGQTFTYYQHLLTSSPGFTKNFLTTTYWYCPAVKWAAKWVTVAKESVEPRVTTVSELVSFEQKR